MNMTRMLLVSSLVIFAGFLFIGCYAGNFYQEFDILWGDGRAKILEKGQLLTLSLDKESGSGFKSKKQYLFGKISMRMKLVPGNSAGTVTTYYLSSGGPNHDEIDFEFLGNLSGQPYIVHTNVYTQGKGDREQQFYLWFNPTKKIPHLLDFMESFEHRVSQSRVLIGHTESEFSVDDTPIREFKNQESKGISFPKNQPMSLSASIWNADDWATRGGQVKTDWSKAPFIASFRDYRAQACIWSSGSSSCGPKSKDPWLSESLDATGLKKMRWARKHYMIYNYCTDYKRFPQGLPKECSLT